MELVGELRDLPGHRATRAGSNECTHEVGRGALDRLPVMSVLMNLAGSLGTPLEWLYAEGGPST